MNEDEDEDTQIRNYQIDQQHRLSKMAKEEVKEVKEEVQCVEFDVVNEDSSVERTMERLWSTGLLKRLRRTRTMKRLRRTRTMKRLRRSRT